MRRRLVAATVWAILIATTPTPAATLFGLVDTGEFFASTDQGATWESRSTTPVSDAVALCADQTSGELRLATRTGVFWASDDGGFSWSAVGSVPASDVSGLAIRSDGTVLLLCETGTLWESVDGGRTFAAIVALTAPDCVGVVVTPSAIHFVLTRSGDVFRSMDAGASWVAVGAMPVPDAVALRHANGLLYALTGTGDLRASTDEGVTWSTIGTLSQVGMAALLESEGELVAITREGHAAASVNGIAWNWRGSINQLRVVGAGTDTPATAVGPALPSAMALSLSPPRPNPRRAPGAATFVVTTDRADVASLALVDVSGRVIARRAAEVLSSAGDHALRWNPGVFGAGVYFVRLETASGATANTRWLMLR